LKLGYDDSLSNFAFKCDLRRYILAGLEYMHVNDSGAADGGGGIDNVTVSVLDGGTGLHSSTFWLNVSAFRGIVGASRGRLGGMFRRCFGCISCQKRLRLSC